MKIKEIKKVTANMNSIEAFTVCKNTECAIYHAYFFIIFDPFQSSDTLYSINQRYMNIWGWDKAFSSNGLNYLSVFEKPSW